VAKTTEDYRGRKFTGDARPAYDGTDHTGQLLKAPVESDIRIHSAVHPKFLSYITI
jgi:hypothetical protein